jgi:broad specificity phosphatase PhoE
MIIYIIRHGQTDFNVGEPRFRGQLDIPLSETGVHQAEAMAIALKNIPLNIIYYSPLQRAKVTAEKIKYHQQALLVEEPLLLTMNFGDWQGRFHSEVFTPEEKELWMVNPNLFVIPNGETFYDVLNRIHRLLYRLKNQSEEQIALVTHNVVIINILLYLFKLDPSHFWDFQVDTASITQIQLHSKRSFKLLKLNETQHLS